MIRILIPTTMYSLCVLATTLFLSSPSVVTAEGSHVEQHHNPRRQQQLLRHLTECDALRACYLVNIETRTETKLIPGNKSNNTAILDLSKHPYGYSIRCDVTDTSNGELDFIKFIYDKMEHDEFGLPRYMYGDSHMGDWINPVPYLQSCGRKTVRVQGHVWSKKCFDRSYSIHMKCPTRDTCPTVITNLILVDAVQRSDIMELSDYSISATMPSNQLNIRAVPKECEPKTTDSVQFILDGKIVRCEKYIPYALYGDPSTSDRIPTDGSKYNGRPISIGTHTITAIPYSGEACTGTKYTGLTRTFTVTP